MTNMSVTIVSPIQGMAVAILQKQKEHRWCNIAFSTHTRQNNRPFYKVKGAVFGGSSWFASHNADVATRWPWYVSAEIWELNILADNRLQEMFEGWTSISFACQISLSRAWRLSITSSHPFWYVWFLHIGIKIKSYTNSYVYYECAK